MPVVKIDDVTIGEGKPHPVAKKIYEEYRNYVKGLHGDHVKWESTK